MENPNSWTRARNVIFRALTEFELAAAQGFVGLSQAGSIELALIEAGFLTLQSQEVIGFQPHVKEAP
jgi:hypothetical protein